MEFSKLSPDQLNELRTTLTDQYIKIGAENLQLDLTRGKPAADQLDLSNKLDGILGGFYIMQDGTDVRNYGGLLGLPEARALGGQILGIPAYEIMAGGNSSLTLMHQYVGHMMDSSWRQQAADTTTDSGAKVKFLCPVPGYDRHFTICEHFDIEMIPIDMNEDGPDMDQIETLIQQDPLIKGIWCVPKYSNPTGLTYAASVVKRFAKLPALAGPDFRIMWDNAYAVHHLGDKPDSLLNLMDEAKKENTSSNIVMLASTSKITFAGAGVAFIGLSETNLESFVKCLSSSAIGPDKVNQLRHVRFLRDAEGIRLHMLKHMDILKPKFELTEKILADNLTGKGIATWTHPNGGYFVSLDTLPGLAKRVIAMTGDVGVKLTPAGATFPYGDDPADQNIRLAPTFPSLFALEQALQIFVVCLQLATVEQLIENNDR